MDKEINLITSAIARINLFLHGINDFKIERGDTLSNPKLLQGDKLQQFDVVLANPPYSIKQWDRIAFSADPYGRNMYLELRLKVGPITPSFRISSGMDPKTGRCAILFPHGVLFRDEEREMRKKMLKHDVIECIFGLGPNLFYNSSMESCVVVCRSKKPNERRNKIQLINAVDEVKRDRTQFYFGKRTYR